MEQLSLFDQSKGFNGIQEMNGAPAEMENSGGVDFTQPLANRLRPKSLDDFVGQEHLLGKGKMLRQLIERDQISSMIFWGPPGVGKTTLASIIAGQTKSAFINFSAVTSGIKEIKEVMQQAENDRRRGRRTVLFVDEIHRFNRAQQDAFLPYVEKGSIVLIGATTENPSFEVNGALLSRCKVFVLKELTEENLCRLLHRALTAPEGFGRQGVAMTDDQIRAIAAFANGDARTALNTLEMAVLNSQIQPDGSMVVTNEGLEQCVSRKSLLYDKSGEEHYNMISALELAVNVYQACHFLGMPECDVHLTHAVTYLAMAPKSNACYVACEEAKRDIKEKPAEPVPLQIRNAVTKLMEDLDYGKGYEYAHNAEEKLTKMKCLPENLQDREYYRPTEQGAEAVVKERLEEIKAWKAQ